MEVIAAFAMAGAGIVCLALGGTWSILGIGDAPRDWPRILIGAALAGVGLYVLLTQTSPSPAPLWSLDP